ncbi:hypothetical protein PZA11_005096 [Diplocarpon coronariae]|uniref:Hydrophobin n=1 Tax=Diplocarpon coronariae TaxID=2795749 RepID=A0A218Z903_9HELO|nr:hypothetical protein B2J93_1408 [Marssonina coronariae]
MQLKLFTTMTLAASVLAAPSVERIKRTGTPLSCAQGQGTQACCQQKPNIVPTSSLGSNIAPALGGILGVIPAILPLIVPTLSVAAQCTPILAVDVQTCNAVNICCLSNGGTGNTNSAALVQILSNNNVAFCPGVTV